MMIFHSYVKLPEGNLLDLLVMVVPQDIPRRWKYPRMARTRLRRSRDSSCGQPVFVGHGREEHWIVLGLVADM